MPGRDTMTSLIAPELELLPCSFHIHGFRELLSNEVRLQCQILRMEESLYVWVGDPEEPRMSDLVLAFATGNRCGSDARSQQPVTTKIMGPLADELSASLAERLSRKTGRPVYVSFNLAVDNLTLPSIERRIQEEFQSHPELLKF